MRRRTLAVLPALPWLTPAQSEPDRRSLRVALRIAEVGFDPPAVSDTSSVTILSHILESPLTYDHLARPAELRPQTAAGLPEVSADYRHWVFTLRPGIFFADDPAFGGRPRELVAADYVYSVKRYYDPSVRTEHLYHFENAKILGLAELRRAAIAARRGLDYDVDVPGLRVLDRYRFEVRLAEPQPRFVQLWASTNLTAALAREVVERYGDQIAAHPVGTGPFRLESWRRGSRVELVRNPGFREQIYSATPPADDPEAQRLAAQLAGRRLPLVDRVVFDVIEEEQPRWLAFSGGEHDVIELPAGMAPLALSRGRLAPGLAARGIGMRRTVGQEVRLTYFNFDHPEVGGYESAQVALRRAISLGLSNAEEVRLVLKGEGQPAQALMVPGLYGHEATWRTGMGAGDIAAARALLDLYGYQDRDGDGWRERPDGTPLVLRLACTTDQRQRAINELWEKAMRALQLRIVFEPGQFGELIKNAIAGRSMMWSYVWTVGNPDGDFFLGMAYGPNSGQSNDARFRLARFDRLYERQRSLPNGPERLQAMRQAQRLMLAYMPYLAHWHPMRTDLTQPGVIGYWRHPFTRDWFRYAGWDQA